MLKRLLLACAVILVVVFLNTALAADHPAKRPVDFAAKVNPRMSGTVSSLGRTGVVVKIQSASIAKDGTITARATIVDGDGTPLDRLGATTPGPVSLSFICAYIPAGQSQFVSYTTTVLAATLNKNPSQTQAANDSGGTFTTNAIGDYTYVFKTKAPTTFDPAATHALGVSARRDLSQYGTFDEWSEVGNDVFVFAPNGGKATMRSVVTTASCNGCHDPLFAHGGSRLQVELCILCHTPQTINPDTGLTQDMKVLIHKIHMGKDLPSVKAGTPYRIWHRGAWSDFSDVAFPNDVRNCTACHDSKAGQPDTWKTNPGMAACGSCHDDVNFATGANHAANAAGVGLPEVDDTQCKGCHQPKGQLDFDPSIIGAHTIANASTSLPGLVTKIVKVTGTTPGVQPVVTFTVTDKKNNGLDISKLTQVRVVLAGPNVDYGTGPGGIRVSETVPTTLAGAGGQYTYTMTNKIPAAAAGSYTISIEARNNVTLLPNTTQATTASDNALPAEFYFTVDKSPVAARRQVVATAKCDSCHGNLQFVHGGTRDNVQECVICHNPALADGTSGQSVNLATQIHSIHRGKDLANPYILGSTNYQEVGFPGDLRDCTACHLAGTYLVEKVGAKAAVASPGGFTKTTPPISAACQGCHDDISTASHALANTTILGESCNACHKAGEAFSVDRVHQRIF